MIYNVEVQVVETIQVEASDIDEAHDKAHESAMRMFDVEDFQVTTMTAKEVK